LEILNTREINLAFVAPPVVVAFAKVNKIPYYYILSNCDLESNSQKL
jgi:hypothetical protein